VLRFANPVNWTESVNNLLLQLVPPMSGLDHLEEYLVLTTAPPLLPIGLRSAAPYNGRKRPYDFVSRHSTMACTTRKAYIRTRIRQRKEKYEKGIDCLYRMSTTSNKGTQCLLFYLFLSGTLNTPPVSTV
jgi:hypothetical protein